MKPLFRIAAALVLVALLAGCTPQRPVVAIVRGDDPNAMVARALELIGGLDRFVKPVSYPYARSGLHKSVH
jgi:hypothetical protein